VSGSGGYTELIVLVERQKGSVMTTTQQGFRLRDVFNPARVEQHHYRIVGPGREVVLELGTPTEPETSIMEIAFPVERISGAELDFLEAIQ
jgi:hypothetical protein